MTLSLYSEIIETKEIKTFIPYVNQDAFVFFNVTGTLYEPSNALSDNRWREYFSYRVKEIVGDTDEAQDLIDRIKNRIVNDISKKTVEDITPRLITLLQDKNIVVLGITQKRMATSYADNFGEITHRHLLSLGIRLERTLTYYHHKSKDDAEQKEFSFAYGILFTNKEPIGNAVVSFIEQSSRVPLNIVMIDNSLDALQEVQQALEFTGIQFTGIRYGRSDHHEDYDPSLGTVEFLAFISEGEILSDEEALKMMPKDKSINYEAILDKFIQQEVNCS